MKKMKKVLAILLAMVMVLGMSMTTFAAGGATITVENADGYTADDGITQIPAAELTYLQIIVDDQTTKTGWAFASKEIEKAYLDGYNGETGKLNAQEVIQELIDARKADGYANSKQIGMALSKVAALKGFAEMANPQEVTSPGVYAVKASQTGYTYNNMAAYVGFGEADNGVYPTLQNANLTAKKSKISLDKSHGDGDKVSAIGQTVTYTIKTNVPYIDPLKKNKTYFIHDKIDGAKYVLEEGSTTDVAGTVTLAGKSLNNALVLDDADSDAFHIDLSDLIDDENSKAGLEVTVTYSAVVTDVDVDNTAKAGHKTDDTYGGEFGEDDEDVYTGGITLTKTGEEDTELLADAGFEVTLNDEIVYFTKDESGLYSHVETKDVPQAVKTALDQAAADKVIDREKLEVTDTTTNVTYVRQVFTKSDGTVKVQGLNIGTYTFTEKTAPKGYSVNEKPATAELKVTNENGVAGSNGNLVATEIIQATTKMSDTKLSSLPSTGGIGTTIFTVGGCAIMIIAAGLYFATKKKAAR